MRLTLRTLLAFMDDILEPQDQEDLARQIEESEKGTELIHRTRDAMRRLRLGAPPVLGQGMELDPNFTSEYLDSTLSSEHMTDYQQVCLDSDVHLAEVASCHHILTMVLGEPAEIDPDMRRRMYTIPQRQAEQVSHRLDAPHTLAAAAASPAPAAEVAPATPLPHRVDDEPMTEVPDYLRAGSQARFNQLLVAGLAILVLGTLGFFSFRPNGWLVGKNDPVDTDPVPVATTGQNDRVAPPDGTTPPVTPADTPPLATDSTPPAGDGELPPSDMAALDSDSATAPPPDGTDLPDLGFGETTPPAAAEEPATEAPNLATDAPLPPITLPADPGSAQPPVAAGETSPDSTPPAPVPTETPAVASPGGTTPDAQPLLPPADGMLPDEGGPAVATPDATNVPGEGVAPLDPATPPSTSAAPEIPIVGPIPAVPPQEGTAPATSSPSEAVPPSAGPLGTLTSPKDILLRYNADTDQWMRMRVNTSVAGGDRLKSLPTYRPSIALTNGLRVELADGTMVTLDRSGDGKWMLLDLAYGRVMIVNTGMDPTVIELRVGDVSQLAEIAPARIVAIDIARPFLPGQSPDLHVGIPQGMVYVPQGGVVWTHAGTPTPVEEGTQWDWQAGPSAKEPFDDAVTWLNGQQLDLLDRNASWRIEQSFDTERPAGEQLLEAYEQSRRREEKVLLAKSAIHVGQFVPFVNALADSNQHSNWDSHITDLRAAMARSPRLAERVHETLREQRGTVPGMADDLFEMLRGYSREDLGSTPEEIKAGVLRKLIGWLNHDRLEYRVLAFHNLRQLTGGKSFLYSPAEANAERRARNIRRWEQMLEDNELVPVETAPAP